MIYRSFSARQQHATLPYGTLSLEEGRGGARLILPVGRQLLPQAVVARKAVDTALNENEAELGVLVLAVALEVLADRDGLFDEAVQVLGKLGRRSGHLQDAHNLATRDLGHLRNAARVPKDHTDLARRQALLGVLEDLLLDVLSLVLAPRGRRLPERQRGPGNPLTTSGRAGVG